jgi:tRNA threonylcarbamoyladenosine modification (KEOPS) complex  Pcc1 subunit
LPLKPRVSEVILYRMPNDKLEWLEAKDSGLLKAIMKTLLEWLKTTENLSK